MSNLVRVATCNLNQWAMDFRGNLERIKESIREAKAAGCTFRTGPELEITGYGCEDSFLELDTFEHAWESLHELLDGDLTDGILCDVGMPVQHRNVAYNCRVVCLDRKIVGLRPKVYLANDGNYREMRYFTPWFVDPSRPGLGPLEEFRLPPSLQALTGATTAPIGVFVVEALDTALSFETCEELFTPKAPHVDLSLDGVELIANGSGSHHQVLFRARARARPRESPSSSSRVSEPRARGSLARSLSRAPSCASSTSASTSRAARRPRRAACTCTRTRRAATAGGSTSTGVCLRRRGRG